MLAETLDLTATEIRMNNIKMYELDEVGRKSLTGDVKQRIAPFSTFFGDFNTDRDAVDSYGIVGLKKEISRRKAEGSPYVSYEIKFYRKLYVPISTIILCVLGVVLSTNHARTGKGISFGVSIFIIAIYMIAMNLIITFAEKNTVPIWFSMSIPNLILAGVTLYLYLRKVKNS
jgi:lipopolysaccharide export system permease protein